VAEAIKARLMITIADQLCEALKTNPSSLSLPSVATIEFISTSGDMWSLGLFSGFYCREC